MPFDIYQQRSFDVFQPSWISLSYYSTWNFYIPIFLFYTSNMHNPTIATMQLKDTNTP